MNIGLDLDGVLYPWHESIYDYHIQNNKFYGTYTEFWTDYWRQPSIQEELSMLCDVPIFYENKVPIPEIMDVLNYLSTKHTLFYITTRHELVKEATYHYLRQWNFPYYENLFITEDKGIYARYLNLDIMVDDREKNLQQIEKVCLPILRARPWNKDFWEKYLTIYTFKEIMEYVK